MSFTEFTFVMESFLVNFAELIFAIGKIERSQWKNNYELVHVKIHLVSSKLKDILTKLLSFTYENMVI